MKRETTCILQRIATVIVALVMMLTLLPSFTADAATKKAAPVYKENKTVNITLTGKEVKTVSFGSDIAKIRFESQKPVHMKKISARKVRIAGFRDGKTSFVVVTKDNRRIVCNITRSHKLAMKQSSIQVIHTSMKVKAVKSYNTSVVKIAMAKDRNSYTVATTGKYGKVKVAVKYANNAIVYITVTNCSHKKCKKVTVTKTQDVYEDQPIYEERWFNNGVDIDQATANYNAAHGTNYVYGDRYIIDDFNTYLNNCGATSGREYNDYVQTGTKRVKTGTKKVKVTARKCLQCDAIEY